MSAPTMRWMMIAALLSSTPAFAECDLSHPPPPAWKRVYLRAASLQLPPDMAGRERDSFDTYVDDYRAPGLAVRIESGMPWLLPDGSEISPQAGKPARVAYRQGESGGREIVADWRAPTAPDVMVRVVARYDDATAEAKACDIVASVRPLDDVGSLRVVRVEPPPERGCARVAGAAGQRRVCIGDYVTINYGKITKVDKRGVEIVELLLNGKGGWRERMTTLAVAPR